MLRIKSHSMDLPACLPAAACLAMCHVLCASIKHSTPMPWLQWLTYWVCYSTLLSVEWVAWGFLMW